MRRLIINADDFGLTVGVNRAILECHQSGIVKSATLMANAAAFPEAVQAAQSAPGLGVGCHLVLVDGAPVLGAEQVPSLIHAMDGAHGPRFHDGSAGLVCRVALGRLAPEHIEAEATAQIRKLQAAGIVVSHLDTHKHTHMIPQVWPPLLRAARACGVRRIRNPVEPVRLSLLLRASLWKRIAEVKLLGHLARRFREAVQQAGMLTPDGTFGIVATGWLDEKLLKFTVQHLAEGTWELVCHPGYNDAQLGSVVTRLRASRQQELRLLSSSATRDLLERNGIELISYAQLA